MLAPARQSTPRAPPTRSGACTARHGKSVACAHSKLRSSRSRRAAIPFATARYQNACVFLARHLNPNRNMCSNPIPYFPDTLTQTVRQGSACGAPSAPGGRGDALDHCCHMAGGGGAGGAQGWGSTLSHQWRARRRARQRGSARRPRRLPRPPPRYRRGCAVLQRQARSQAGRQHGRRDVRCWRLGGWERGVCSVLGTERLAHGRGAPRRLARERPIPAGHARAVTSTTARSARTRAARVPCAPTRAVAVAVRTAAGQMAPCARRTRADTAVAKERPSIRRRCNSSMSTQGGGRRRAKGRSRAC